MLTEEQANQLRLEQYALEDAEIRYNKVQQQLEKYNTLLNTIKDNYNSYTPEQKARISAKMGDISAKYRELKDQSYKYSIAQYEAQQQIDYYNQLAAQQAPTNGVQRRRQVYVPETVIEPVPETIVQPIGGFGGNGWVNNNGTLTSPDGATQVYPDGSISFGGVETTPYKQNYYDVYAQMKGTGTPSMDIAKWFRGNLGQANGVNSTLVRQDLAKRGLTNQQINDFVQDWGNATLASLDVQNRLDSPQRIRTYGNENRPGIQRWGTGVGTL